MIPIRFARTSGVDETLENAEGNGGGKRGTRTSLCVHVPNTWPPVGVRLLLGNACSLPCDVRRNYKGPVVGKEVMRKRGDAQLVLRLEASLWLWQTVKSLARDADSVTNVYVCLGVCGFP